MDPKNNFFAIFIARLGALLTVLLLSMSAIPTLANPFDPSAQLDPSVVDRQNLMPTESHLGQISARIVGGNVATVGQQRWISSIEFQDRHVCGAALIAPNWLMTAAHCVFGLPTSNGAMTVWVGGNDRRVETQGERRIVGQVITHPNYDPNTFAHDLALLRVNTPINNIEPVRLANAQVMTNEAAPGQPVTVSGWGLLAEGGGAPNQLHDVTIPVVSNTICNGPLAYSGRVTSTMLCAGLQQGGQDACQGDSGGPLWLNLNGIDVHVGLVSWGTGCARPNKYGVYTRSATYRNWIASTANIALASPIPTPPDDNTAACNPPTTPNTPAREPYERTFTLRPMAQGGTSFFEIRVDGDITKLLIETTGGVGDLDIYLAEGSRPNTSSYDYASRLPTSSESIRITNPTPGTWYLTTFAYSSYRDVTLKVRFEY
jgi:hypothetical protein